MQLGDGDGFVRCACGNRHWGLHGAAGLLLSDPGRGVLLQRRAWWTHHGRTWALPGGAVRSGESPEEAAARETEEETAVPRDAVRVRASATVDHGTWRYTTVLATVRERVRAHVANAESTDLRWVPPEEVAGYPLHRDFAAAWPELRAQLDRELVVVVDAANVVGSRPDGWWRDRAAAAARLRDRLGGLVRSGVCASDVALPLGPHWSWWPRVVLVVEGHARGTEPSEHVEVVPAEQDGDTAVVVTARAARAARPDDHVVVVTADRGLRERVRGTATEIVGPATLWDLLDRS
ncbi:ADP-ribose pyrophosphatase YjhB (NUDIX family) [Prauserella shujinwangii]|uniref:ADP-ribose pyrophosphatase YjhB (NUDIX family) n=1 Tax=Prauserella shujinwangii TaxID=1453103 RepID=A0A2T0M317_9PSEU|nr:NUDIX hydrolase [Prauserella shujinwangii]PRX51151.1 ADP-ribose pyrophosphatase YjhB (NUDIX family) [Prauserella shujinwangii]